MKTPSIKVILVDGVSNVGKTTFIDAIRGECIKNGIYVHYIHPTKNIIESPYTQDLTKTRNTLVRMNGLLKSLAAFETHSVTGIPEDGVKQTIDLVRVGLLNGYLDSIKYAFKETLHIAKKKDDFKHVIIMDRSFLTGLVYNNISPNDTFFHSEDGYMWELRLRSVTGLFEGEEENSLHSILVTGPVRSESEEGKETFDSYYDEESRVKKETYESWYRRYQELFFFQVRNHYSMVFENNGSLEELIENARALIN